MRTPPTMADVAKVAGVHQTTVSLALRNHGRLPEETRARIRKIAEQLGYRPNPLVSALIAGRRRGSATVRGTGLAFLTTGSTRASWKKSVQYTSLFALLRNHADARGYTLSELWLDEPKLSPERARRILISRGIHGVVVCPLLDDRHRLDFDVADFASIALGHTLHQPALDHVASDYGGLMQHTLRQLVDGGFKRIGFATDRATSERVNHASLAAALAARALAPARILAPCIVDHDWTESISRWLNARKPDVLVVPTEAQLERTRVLLKSLGLKTPDDVSLVCVDCHAVTRSAGMVRDLDEEARAAIEWLTSRVERGAFGIPKRPRTILVGGNWREGETVCYP